MMNDIFNSRVAILEHILNIQFGSGGSNRWKSFQHNGVLFPPEYVPHGVPMLYNTEKVKLDPDAEEVAMLYAKYVDSPYIENKTFNKNFWYDWKHILGKNHIIQSLELCNFTEYKNIIIANHEKRKETMTDDIKEQRNKDEEKYKIAIVDGKEQPVGNYRIEPPGIFIGRGCNPKLGMVKKRIYPEDIIINIGKESPVPTPPDGHHWQKVIHDKSVEWLASWKDDITGKIKYVWLGAHSDFKASSDQHKFDLARKLKKKIHVIVEENEKNMQNGDIKTKQIATALYFIDRLALRVGNEKGDDEADTVGVTSLRIEHVELKDDEHITLDFLGKDSIRYNNTVKIDKIVHDNVKEFMQNKTKDDQLFDKIVANDINKYLQMFMDGLTAKVFRTYNASNLFQKELKKISKKHEESDEKNIPLLMDEYSKANAKVAMLCNHQKNINKSFKAQVESMDTTIKNIKSKLRKAKNNKQSQDKINKIIEQLQKAKSKRELKMELKNIALGTSKANYIDPRITVAFMKLHNLPVEKVFSRALQDKFKWAFSVDADYKF